MKTLAPDYLRIYRDMIDLKYPEKKEICERFLSKKKLTALDVICLNKEIFGTLDKEIEEANQRHRSYDRNTILSILEYQRAHNLNNIQLARYFKLSRNSIAKWKNLYNRLEI